MRTKAEGNEARGIENRGRGNKAEAVKWPQKQKANDDFVITWLLVPHTWE